MAASCDAQLAEGLTQSATDTEHTSHGGTGSASSGPVSKCPNEYLCPITGGLMRDPVLLVQTGHSFERIAIEAWFHHCMTTPGISLTCPLTRATLSSTQVSPNVTLRKLIQDWAARHPTHSAFQQTDSQPGLLTVPVLPNGTSVPAIDILASDTPSRGFGPTGAPDLLPSVPAVVLGLFDPTAPQPFYEQSAYRLVFPMAAEIHRRIAAGIAALDLRAQRGQLVGPRTDHAAGPYVLGASLPPAEDDELLENDPAVADASSTDAGTDAAPALRLVPDFETVGTVTQEMLVLAHVAAPERGRRVPIDLVAVLDVSKSMSGSRFALLKQTMDFVISQLEPSDRLSIVAFSARASRAIKLTRATDRGKEQLKAAMSGLRTQGGTSILSGLKLGLHVLTSRRQSNPVACMFLLSDGQDTSGLEEYEEHRQELTTSASAGNVPVHTFGYGSDHDERTLDAISAGTNGTFSYLRGELGMKLAVAQFLGGAVSVAFQATTVHLTAAPGAAISSVNAGAYEATVDEEHMSASVALKDLYAGETRDFLVKVRLPAADDRLLPTDLLTGRVEYTLPGQEEVHRSPSVTVSVARGECPEGTQSNVEVDLQRNRLDAALSMRTADALADSGRCDEARANIALSINVISGSVSAPLPACAGVLDDLREVERGLASAQEYRREGSKVVKSASRMHASQRAAYTSSGPLMQDISVPRRITVSQYASPRAAEMSSLSVGYDTV